MNIMVPLLYDTTMVTTLCSTTSDSDDEMRMKTKADMKDLLPIFSTACSTFELTPTGKSANECPLSTDLTVECMPYFAKPEIDCKQSTVLEINPTVTNITDIPVNLPGKEEPCLVDQNSKWEENSKTKEIFTPFAPKDDQKNEEVILLATPSQWEYRSPESLSLSQYSSIICERNMVNICTSCPVASNIPGSPSINECDGRSWETEHKPLFERKIKTEPIMKSSPTAKEEIKLMVALLTSCPQNSSIPGIPSIMQPAIPSYGSDMISSCCKTIPSFMGFSSKKTNTDCKPLAFTCPKEPSITGLLAAREATVSSIGFSSVNLLLSCPAISSTCGLPSMQKPDSKDWIIIFKPLWKKHVEKECVLLLDSNKNVKDIKGAISLAASCPTRTVICGLPSAQKQRMTNGVDMRDMASLSNSCSKVSHIPGIPSRHYSEDWIMTREPIFEPIKKETMNKKQVTDTSARVKTMGNAMVFFIPNIVSFVSSCPKKSNIAGCPSILNPELVYYGQNVVNRLPLCPIVSSIPGFSTVKGHKDKGWTVGLGLLMKRPSKSFQFKMDSLFINIDGPNNMLAMAPTCSRASRIPGFPSLPLYNMLSLAPVCPKISSLPGFAAFQNASKFQWFAGPHIFCKKSSREIVFETHSPNQDVKTMLAIMPCCSPASRIAGFPSAETKTEIEPSMLSFIHCCPSVSNVKGFASVTANLSTMWLNETQPILTKPQRKKAEMVPLFAVKDQPYCDNAKSMVTFVASCPKKARVCGFPSAQVANRPPNMTSLHTSAACVSSVPGFPSARMLSAEHINIQPRKTHGKRLFEKLQNVVKFQVKHGYLQEEINIMVAMTPSIAHSTQIPGFPSVSQLSPAEKETLTTPLLWSNKTHTSPESPHEQSSHSYLNNARISGGPSPSFCKPSTAVAYGAKQTIDLSVNKGKSHMGETAAVGTKTCQLDTSEPVGVLGWELLEAEGTITGNQTESLPTQQEDTTGLLKTIAGVFHKGYETVASILGPSNSTLDEVDHQPMNVPSMVLKDKPLIPHSVDKAAPTPADQFETFVTKHNVEYSTSAEPYMRDLVGFRSTSSSSTTDSEDDFFVCANIKKWPPLTEADIPGISKEDIEQVEEQKPPVDQCNTKAESLTGQDSVQASVYIESLLANHQTETEKEGVRTVSMSSELDKG
ncbi:uncharacterized protein [Antennarius striatus]|uniref:uncharacterized protein n=1 Tax=Antennarius striatus TaxID=241820 RepID=UPI0035B3CC46